MTWAPLRSLRVRVVAAVGVALLSMVAAQVFQGWQQEQLRRSLTLITKGYSPIQRVVGRLDDARERVDADVQRLVRGEARGGATAKLYADQMERNLNEGHIHVKFARRLGPSAEEQAILNKVDAQIVRIHDGFAEWQVDLDAYGKEDATDETKARLLAEGTGLGDEIDRLSRLVEGRVTELTRAAERAQERASLVAGVASLIALALSAAAVAAVLVALRPIGRLTTEVQRVGKGDYTGHIELVGHDEIGVLASEFDKMIRAIKARDEVLSERAHELDRLSRYLGSVLDTLADALIVVEDGNVTLANPAANRVWGAVVGAPPPAALALTPGLHNVDHDGAFEVHVVPYGEGGRLVVASDVTDQTRTRERLMRSERLAAIGQMLAQVTHEVRNPLNALSLNAELLADELLTLDPGKRSDAWAPLRTVTSEIERLTQVTGHYLQLARRPRAVLALEDVGAVVDDVARLLEAELAQGGVTLTVRAEPGITAPIDGNQTKQALLNIVRNAVEAGARHLVLSIERTPADVTLALHDDGPGMTPEQLVRASEPFWSTKATGTGLGLAIVRQIVEDHGGALRIDSAPDRGTTVALVLGASSG